MTQTPNDRNKSRQNAERKLIQGNNERKGPRTNWEAHQVSVKKKKKKKKSKNKAISLNIMKFPNTKVRDKILKASGGWE